MKRLSTALLAPAFAADMLAASSLAETLLEATEQIRLGDDRAALTALEAARKIAASGGVQSASR